ncbi:hypothetical protein ACS0TY_034452 [Phlomoides rotata]
MCSQLLGLKISEGESPKLEQYDNNPAVRQVVANGICMRTCVVEAKLDAGNIQEAESVLRDKLSLNFEVIEYVFQQDWGQTGVLEKLSKNGFVGNGQVTDVAALKELRKISNLLSEM